MMHYWRPGHTYVHYVHEYEVMTQATATTIMASIDTDDTWAWAKGLREPLDQEHNHTHVLYIIQIITSPATGLKIAGSNARSGLIYLKLCCCWELPMLSVFVIVGT